jgi:hypothetical protein
MIAQFPTFPAQLKALQAAKARPSCGPSWKDVEEIAYFTVKQCDNLGGTLFRYDDRSQDVNMQPRAFCWPRVKLLHLPRSENSFNFVVRTKVFQVVGVFFTWMRNMSISRGLKSLPLRCGSSTAMTKPVKSSFRKRKRMNCLNLSMRAAPPTSLL